VRQKGTRSPGKSGARLTERLSRPAERNRGQKSQGKSDVNHLREAVKQSAQLKAEIRLNPNDIPVAFTVFLSSEPLINSAGWFAFG
jgi:hypothetical protein